MTRAGLPHSETPGSTLGCQLPRAYRRLPRPSSALDAKASTMCPYQLAKQTLNTHNNPPPHPPPKQPAAATANRTRAHQGTCPTRSRHNKTNTTNKHHPHNTRAGGCSRPLSRYQKPHTKNHNRAPRANPQTPPQQTGHPNKQGKQDREPRRLMPQTPNSAPYNPPHPTGQRHINVFHYPNTPNNPSDTRGQTTGVLLRKEVIQPHLPVRLPCYDFVPIASPTFDGSPCKAVRPPASGVADFRDVTGGVYKARERIHRSVADLRLLATPTSWGRVADPNPN